MEYHLDSISPTGSIPGGLFGIARSDTQNIISRIASTITFKCVNIQTTMLHFDKQVFQNCPINFTSFLRLLVY